MTDVPLFLIAKLQKIIWTTRCLNLEEKQSVDDSQLLRIYKKNLKVYLTLEKKRLSKYEFNTIYSKNNVLCRIQDKAIIFSF